MDCQPVPYWVAYLAALPGTFLTVWISLWLGARLERARLKHLHTDGD